jgi:DNA-binding NarL/FixJ family response regulator
VQRRILIVDDSAEIRKALRWIIQEQSDWRVCGEASDGAEGIYEAVRLKPDIVVLDFSMPVMNGIDAAARIKRLIPGIHLLMFTSYETSSIENAARSVGIDALVDKGNRTKLLQTLHAFE